MLGRVVIHEGSGRRRRWTAEEKGRIVALTLAPGAKVSEVARQFDLSPQHLFLWRREAKAGKLVAPVDDDMMFTPVVTDHRPAHASDGVTIEVAGAVVRATWSTDFKLLAVIVGALKGAA